MSVTNLTLWSLPGRTCHENFGGLFGQYYIIHMLDADSRPMNGQKRPYSGSYLWMNTVFVLINSFITQFISSSITTFGQGSWITFISRPSCSARLEPKVQRFMWKPCSTPRSTHVKLNHEQVPWAGQCFVCCVIKFCSPSPKPETNRKRTRIILYI